MIVIFKYLLGCCVTCGSLSDLACWVLYNKQWQWQRWQLIAQTTFLRHLLCVGLPHEVCVQVAGMMVQGSSHPASNAAGRGGLYSLRKKAADHPVMFSSGLPCGFHLSRLFDLKACAKQWWHWTLTDGKMLWIGKYRTLHCITYTS